MVGVGGALGVMGQGQGQGREGMEGGDVVEMLGRL